MPTPITQVTDLLDRLRHPMFTADEFVGVRLDKEALIRDMSDAATEIERLRHQVMAALDCLGHDDPKGAYRALTAE